MTERLYDFLYNDLSLKTAGLVVGTLLLVSHVFAFLNFEKLRILLPQVPRHEKLGTAIMSVAFAWALLVWTEMDLGEFFNLERPVQFIIVGMFFGVVIYVKEFIGARAIGFFLILAACPVLDAAFLEPPLSRLLVVALAYAWILLGMFWVGMPYVLRDQIAWAVADARRWKALTLAGAIYGALVLICALAFY